MDWGKGMTTKMEKHVDSLMSNIHRQNAITSLETLGKLIDETRKVLDDWKKENQRMRNLIEATAKMEAELN